MIYFQSDNSFTKVPSLLMLISGLIKEQDTLTMQYMLKPGVGDEEKPGLPEGSLDLIGESSRGEAASDGRAADVPGINRI